MRCRGNSTICLPPHLKSSSSWHLAVLLQLSHSRRSHALVVIPPSTYLSPPPVFFNLCYRDKWKGKGMKVSLSFSWLLEIMINNLLLSVVIGFCVLSLSLSPPNHPPHHKQAILHWILSRILVNETFIQLRKSEGDGGERGRKSGAICIHALHSWLVSQLASSGSQDSVDFGGINLGHPYTPRPRSCWREILPIE